MAVTEREKKQVEAEPFQNFQKKIRVERLALAVAASLKETGKELGR